MSFIVILVEDDFGGAVGVGVGFGEVIELLACVFAVVVPSFFGVAWTSGIALVSSSSSNGVSEGSPLASLLEFRSGLDMFCLLSFLLQSLIPL